MLDRSTRSELSFAGRAASIAAVETLVVTTSSIVGRRRLYREAQNAPVEARMESRLKSTRGGASGGRILVVYGYRKPPAEESWGVYGYRKPPADAVERRLCYRVPS